MMPIPREGLSTQPMIVISEYEMTFLLKSLSFMVCVPTLLGPTQFESIHSISLEPIRVMIAVCGVTPRFVRMRIWTICPTRAPEMPPDCPTTLGDDSQVIP